MFVFLAAYAIWSIGAADAGQRREWVLAAATQWSNIQGAIGPPFSPHLGHLWSLSAEVQFYVAWGIGLWYLLRRGSPRGAVIGFVVALFVVSWVERAALTLGGTPWNRPYLGPDTRASALLVGCALGLAYAWGWLRPNRVLAAALVPSLVLLGWIVLELSFLDDRTYTWALGAASLAWGVVVANAVVGLHLGLAARPLAALGRISYSVYLWHLPLLHELARRHDDLRVVAAIGIPLSVAVGAASYALVERPFLRVGRAPRRVPAVP
jgi:peptidoglycan/LPS O-acetylase OafA/YrhL